MDETAQAGATKMAETAGEALREALARAAGTADGADATVLATQVEEELRALGWKVAPDWHARPAGGRHGPDCYHCGRPENTEPFVIPGTPIELFSSEGEQGRWRHWGGDDVWVCRNHPHDMDGDQPDVSYTRAMGLGEALEHAAARDAIPKATAITIAQVNEAAVAYREVAAGRLAELDAAAPGGGHAGIRGHV